MTRDLSARPAAATWPRARRAAVGSSSIATILISPRKCSTSRYRKVSRPRPRFDHASWQALFARPPDHRVNDRLECVGRSSRAPLHRGSQIAEPSPERIKASLDFGGTPLHFEFVSGDSFNFDEPGAFSDGRIATVAAPSWRVKVSRCSSLQRLSWPFPVSSGKRSAARKRIYVRILAALSPGKEVFAGALDRFVEPSLSRGQLAGPAYCCLWVDCPGWRFAQRRLGLSHAAVQSLESSLVELVDSGLARSANDW
jgi:hypothetical protein